MTVGEGSADFCLLGKLYTCSSSLARGHGRPMPSWGLEELEVLALEPYTGDGA